MNRPKVSTRQFVVPLIITALTVLTSSCDIFWQILYGQAAVPTGLNASHSTSSEYIELSWDAQSAAASYRIYRTQDWENSASYTLIGESAGASYQDRSVEPDTNYWYEITAVDRNGRETAKGGPAYGARRGTGGAAAIPYSVRATKADYGKITITWNIDTEHSPQSAVFRSENPDGSSAVRVATVTGTRYEWSGDELWPIEYNGLECLAGKIYYFFVCGVSRDNASVLSARSGTDTGYSFGGDASIPASFTATEGSYAGLVRLGWATTPSASYYIIRRTAPGGSVRTFNVRIPATSFDDTEAVPGVHYEYTIMAQADTNRGSMYSNASAPISGWAEVLAGLLPPANLRATLVSSLSASLAWDTEPAASGYRIYRAASDAGPWTLLGSTSASAWNDYGLSPSTAYWYKVSSYSGAGEGNAGASIQISTKSTASLEAPTNVAAVPGGSPRTSILVSWNASSGADAYRVWRSAIEAGPFVYLAETSATSFEDTGLENDSRWYYRVTAFNTDDESPMSATASAVTWPPVPAAPEEFSAAQGGISSVGLVWKPVAHAVSYNIYRSTNDDAHFGASPVGNEPHAPVSWLHWYDTGCLAGRSYFYKVRAVNSVGEEGPASIVYEGWLAPMGYDRPEPKFTSASDTQVNFQWTAATQGAVTGYELWRSAVDNSTWQWVQGPWEYLGITVASPSYSHTFAPADKGKIYSYKVAAVSASGTMGPRSNYPITVMNGTDISLTPDKTTAGLIYPTAPVRYTFVMPANTRFFIYLVHYDNIRQFNAVISVLDGNGDPFQDYEHPGFMLSRVPATGSFYTVDAYQIESGSETTVTLLVEAEYPTTPSEYMVRFAIEATSSAAGHLRPW